MKLRTKQYVDIVLGLELPEEDLDLFQEQLWAFYRTYRSDKEFRNYLLNPKLSNEKRIEWLAEAFNEIFARFISIVLDNNDVDELKAVIKRLEEARDKKLGVTRVVMETAFQPSEQTMAEAKKVLEKKLGKEIRLVTEINQDLIGGCKFRIGDEVIDDSLQNRIHQLQENLSV